MDTETCIKKKWPIFKSHVKYMKETEFCMVLPNVEVARAMADRYNLSGVKICRVKEYKYNDDAVMPRQIFVYTFSNKL